MEEVTSKEWTLSAGRVGEHPTVTRSRSSAFERDLGKPEYSTAVVVQVALNDPDDEGLPSAREGDQLRDVENALRMLVGPRGLLVSVITGLGLRQFTWYGASPEWSSELLDDIDATITSHGVRVLARSDPEWEFARTLLD